jgi:hypothetical protein
LESRCAAKANAFPAKHKPSDGGVSFNKAMIVVFWDDGSYPTEYQIADLGERSAATAPPRSSRK